MTVQKIVMYSKNKSALRRKSQPIRKLNPNVKQVIRDLKDTLADHPEGAGLSAPQINVHRRMIVVRLGIREETDPAVISPTAMINPEILEARDERRDFDGCLSFPGLYGTTRRPHYLKVKGLDETGQPFERVFVGFDAILVHHEIDHLDGILFIDRVERLEDLYSLRVGHDGNLEHVPVVTTFHIEKCL